MPLLSPFNPDAAQNGIDLESNPAQIEVKELVAANELLHENGLSQFAAKEQELSRAMAEAGLDLVESLRNLKILGQYSENENVRLQAVRTHLELCGHLGSRKDQSADKSVTFVIQGAGQVQMSSILNPQRQQ